MFVEKLHLVLKFADGPISVKTFVIWYGVTSDCKENKPIELKWELNVLDCNRLIEAGTLISSTVI